ncbi:MAG TPA: AraC family transcriptional regulator [Chitinophagaceae bacterium]|nr:AraC family transcriptional regulator [Chitinophagaceae bacterium]
MRRDIQKHRGFEGELIIEIPRLVIAQCRQLSLVNALYIARMGFYPKALHHYFQRPAGISDLILIYCTAGRGWIQSRKKKMVLESGHLCLLPPGIPHAYWADEEAPWTIYWFHLQGKNCLSLVQAITGDKGRQIKPIPVSFSAKRDTVFKQIGNTLLKGYSNTNLLFANLLLQYYLASLMIPDQFQQEITNVQQAGATDKAIAFMQQKLSAKISLQDIAGAANLSVSFFSRKFKEETGYAPIEYFNYLRVQKACQLLHFSKLRVSEIAYELGIADPLYFSRLFRQQMGVSPARYRKQGSTLQKIETP